MRYFIPILLFLFCASPLFGQNNIVRPLEIKTENEFENLDKQLLFSDAKVTSVLLWIKKGVKPHYHAEHSEHVMVLKGKATMHLGEETLEIRKGDMIFIPKGTPHDVTVHSRVLKVVSIQAPEFTGKDRVWVE